jgi:hypothetical protein
MSAGWLAVAGTAAWGQQGGDTAKASAAADEKAQDQPKDEARSDFHPQVLIHGYLSQAYAFSDGHQIIGIPKKGTADYSTAAVQIRAEMTPQDSFLVQFQHERNGLSPIDKVHQDAEVDWLFYQHKLGASTVKVGRMPIPFGIYNEVRDVGTLLPFFRPARPVYEETSFSTEKIDGVLLSHGFDLKGGWHLDGTVHYGNWGTFDGQLNPVRSDKSRGLELWLDTPFDGLRLGIGGFQCDQTVTAPTRVTHLHRQLSHLSLDGRFGQVVAQVEFKRDTAQLATGGRNSQVNAGYGHLGYNFTEKISLHGEYDFLNVDLVGVPEIGHDRDRAASFNYAFRPDLVLKAEYHWVSGFRVDDAPGLIPGRPVPNYKTQFGILSLSASF